MRHGAPSADAIARFLREAKIQARLDHPAIVPVHELGHDAEGRPYFTMKRLAGRHLARLIPETRRVSMRAT
jgi:serine/threonine-protein kinase